MTTEPIPSTGISKTQITAILAILVPAIIAILKVFGVDVPYVGV